MQVIRSLSSRLGKVQVLCKYMLHVILVTCAMGPELLNTYIWR